MVSPGCDFKLFVEELKCKEYPDIIYLAEQEALEAWRLAQRRIREGSMGHQESMRYCETLKELIFFLRYGIKPRESSREDLELFDVVCGGLRRNHHRSRCREAH